MIPARLFYSKETGSFSVVPIVQIPATSGENGWVADDMSQDDTVVTLASEGLEGGEYVVRYDPVADGEVTVGVWDRRQPHRTCPP